MSRFYSLISVIALGAFANCVWGYELSTHGAITQNAYRRIIQNDGAFLSNLGLKAGDQLIDSYYYDIYRSDIIAREPKVFERDLIQGLAAC